MRNIYIMSPPGDKSIYCYTSVGGEEQGIFYAKDHPPETRVVQVDTID
jgi:hypothetical protein